ncbi:hypothetical protein NLG97_g9757 [Lecanicillium saksenae]|uniref:Uncharacterized protein n=1 Tax=Lecanicillium saksenae TaxID=468837 RepID=A0ACC1QJ25_9HYPO|nr:hypothetical protein NLG97_g9757 [Lecanicillium saksenae]
MPPRVGSRAPLAAADAVLLSSPKTVQQTCRFSTTPCREKSSAARRKMFAWINSRKGQELANSTKPATLTGQTETVFPSNPLYRSEPVVNDTTRRLIYERATKEGQALKAIAAEMGLDVRRVAAIVRLKEAQRQWASSRPHDTFHTHTAAWTAVNTQQGKQLATPYAKAVQGMLPKWGFIPGEKNRPFEPVNDIHVHRYTMQQLFVPRPH